MGDLIDRQAAIDALSTPHGILYPIRTIENMPPAEPERKKGHWIVDALANNIYRCSECGVDAPVEPTGGTEYKSNYCPHCGADMRGGQDEVD